MSIATVIEPGVGTYGDIATLITDGLASYVGLPQPVMAGFQYGTYTMTWAGNGYSLIQGDNPAAVLGDVYITQTVTTPGSYAVVIDSDATVQVLVGGDTSRQSFIYERYDLSLNAIDGPATVWVNEVGAIWANPLFLANLPVGTAITPISLAQAVYATSPSGDVLTFALASGNLPPGLALSFAGLISGTPTQAGSFQFTVNATDSASITTMSALSQIAVVPAGAQIATTAVFGPVVSAWTADATHVTADSVSFTCDGADLINGGGTDIPQPPSKGPAITKSQYLRF